MRQMYIVLVLLASGVLFFLAIFLYPLAAVDAGRTTPSTPYVFAVTNLSYTMSNVVAFAVIDKVTGEVLVSQNGEKRLPLASVTKLLVAGAIIDEPWLSDTATITASDVTVPGMTGGLVVGQVYTYRELLFPFLLASANDAGAALWRNKESEITNAVTTMLQEADVATGITLTDSTGLATTDQGTAITVASLVRYLAIHRPTVFDITELPFYVGPYTAYQNNIPVASDVSYRGGKHGYTDAAGRTLTAIFTTPFADGERELIYVILGADNVVKAQAELADFVTNHITRTATTSVIISNP